MVTYFLHSETKFNVVDLLIRYIERIYIAHDPNYHRKANLALGHLIAYPLEVKYNIFFCSPHNHILSLLTNK